MFIQYLKMDEMLEKESNLKTALRNRAGMLGILLNTTFDHDLQNRIEAENERNRQESIRQKEAAEETKLKEKEKRELRKLKKANLEKNKTVKVEKVEKVEKVIKVEQVERVQEAGNRQEDKKVHLPSKREKKHNSSDDRKSGESQPTASQLYKKLKSSY